MFIDTVKQITNTYIYNLEWSANGHLQLRNFSNRIGSTVKNTGILILQTYNSIISSMLDYWFLQYINQNHMNAKNQKHGTALNFSSNTNVCIWSMVQISATKNCKCIFISITGKIWKLLIYYGSLILYHLQLY